MTTCKEAFSAVSLQVVVVVDDVVVVVVVVVVEGAVAVVGGVGESSLDLSLLLASS